MTVVDRFVQAVAHGGAMPRPTLIVVHSAETPLRPGYAASIATNWFGNAASGVQTSAHFMVDPAETIRMLSDNVVAYHVGPAANGFTLGIEQAGYARLTRDEWTTPAGLTQLRKVGALIAELAAAHGIPLRWATDDQIRAAARGVPGGVCFHDDIHRVLGGTTHTDPMPHYPADLLQQAWTAPQEDDVPYRDWPKADRDQLLTDIAEQLHIAAHLAAYQSWPKADRDRMLTDIQEQLGYAAPMIAEAAQSGDAAAVAAAIPAALAQQVVDLLGQRLATGPA